MIRVIDLLDHGLSREPTRECLRDPCQSYTHREVELASHRIAHAIRAAGIKRGARVGFFTPNCAQAMIAMIAVFRAGAVWLPVHPRNTLAENSEFLAGNNCELLFFHSRTARESDHFMHAVPSLRARVCLDESLAQGEALLTWAAGYPDHFRDESLAPDDIAWVKGTGGTTGRSKSVLINNRSAVTLVASFNWCLPLPSGHVTLVAAPISHGAGTYALCALCNGGSVVLIDKAEPSAVLDAICAYGITTVFLPPTVIYGMLAHPAIRERKYPSLRYLIYSAAPMSPDRLAEAIEVFGPVLTQIYGQTEALAMLTVLRPEEHLVAGAGGDKRLTSCGRATPFVKLGIMADDGHLLDTGEVGEIVVRSEMVMQGYRDDPEETARVSQFGWHHTGDVGMRDEAGFFYIVDRKKDMIISGGFNIFPSEIEQVLWKHPAVLDCAVVGAPDAKWGEAVTAVVELKPGQLVQGSELQQFCRDALGSLKTPKRVEIWPQLPRSSVGKVLRKDVRERFWKGQTRRV